MTIPDGSLISYFSTLVKKSGGINLAQGIPGFAPPLRLVEHLKKSISEAVHQYPPGTGNFSLVKQLISFYNEPAVTKDNVLIVQGATEALSLVFFYVLKKLRAPFSTLSFSPPYESYRQLPQHFGMPFIEVVPEDEERIPLHLVEKHIKEDNVKLIFLASPGNPQGIVFSKPDIDKLVDICSENHCYLLFDAVYQTIYFGEPPYVPVNKINPYLFIADSFSKWFSITGWRIGYLIHDQIHTQDLRSLHDYTGLCANSVMQAALTGYIEDHNFGKQYSENIRTALSENYFAAHQQLVSLGFQPGKADGGYFIWTRLPERFNNGFDFALSLYNSHAVAVVPGIHFTPHGQNYIRINVARTKQELADGLNKISLYCSEH